MSPTTASHRWEIPYQALVPGGSLAARRLPGLVFAACTFAHRP